MIAEISVLRFARTVPRKWFRILKIKKGARHSRESDLPISHQHQVAVVLLSLSQEKGID
ncbi:hypothetical protein AHAS_Ahas19G0011100 [Arachis hypogaea]